MNEYADDNIDIFTLINPVLYYRKFIFFTTFFIVIITLVFLIFFKKNSYKAEIKLFIGKSADPITDIGSNAFGDKTSEDIYTSNFGLDVAKFYQVILMSKPFLIQVALAEIDMGERGKMNAYDFFKIDPKKEMGSEIISNILSGIISSKTDKTSGIMTLEIRTKDPKFSMEFANILTNELEKYSLDFVIKRSKIKRLYIDSKIKESESKLSQVEEKLNQFRLTNRRIETSPELQMIEDRLKRNVQIEQEINISFAKELEKIKLDEKRGISPLIVLEYASLPVSKDGISKRNVLFISGIVGLFFSIFVSFILEFFKKLEQKNSEEFKKFKINLNSTFNDIKKLFFINRIFL